MDLSRLKIEREAPRGRARTSRGGPWFGRLTVLAALGSAAWLFRDPLTQQIDRLRLPTVTTARAERSNPAAATALAGTSSNGHLVARVRAALSADTPGRIIELNVTEGQQVERGFVVARLYARELEADRERARADLNVARAAAERAALEVATAAAELDRLRSSLESATADLTEAEAQRDLAAKQLERARQLVADGVENIDRLDQTTATLDAAAARVRSVHALIGVARDALATGESRRIVAEAQARETGARIAVVEAELARAEATLDKTIIRAPFDGIVVLKDAEVGEVVSPNSQAGGSARGSVATMVDFASLEVQAEVPETSLAAVQLDSPARVFMDAFPSEGFDGHVSRVWPTANRQKATVEVRVLLDRIDPRMRPEMGVRVVFLAAGEAATTTPSAPAEPAILVPLGALVRDGGQSRVFVLERDRVTSRVVEIGNRTPTQAAIRTGLSEDDLVVIDPPPTLKDGDRVRRSTPE